MRKLLIILLFTTCNYGFAQSLKLNEIRESFFELTFDSKNTPQFYDELKKIADPSPTVTAYMGATQALMVKHAWNPFSKWKFLRLSEKTLRKAVNKDPENVEVRFLRFSVEKNIPHMLGFSEHIEGDQDFLLTHIDKFDMAELNDEYFKFIYKFFEEQVELSDEELERVRNVLLN